ncbi:protein-disulfide reductase DsbD family protein [Rhizorhapis sp. SPR117]|uniref:protein-disulfide reductase DsbD family protein n=1 Tax=Rhizorhapis sp. SPR117 TaxID=2912611 RepID=UPI001F300DE3|nr:thioredoxin family protein [Rhizorhapis sp. SPR117]
MRIFHFFLMTIAALCTFSSISASAQSRMLHVPATLVAESDAPAPGQSVTLAFVMKPHPGWHGYWENPGDAGKGMTLKWDVPPGVKVGALRYPVPETLLLSGLMNYVYEGDYALLVTLDLPQTLRAGDVLPVRVRADWLSCTREICVPEGDDLALDLRIGDGGVDANKRAEFDKFRAHLPRPLAAEGRFALAGERIRLAIPFPKTAAIAAPYFFPLTENAIAYASPQSVTRNGDWLIVETNAGGSPPQALRGLIKTGEHRGFTLTAVPGPVPQAGVPVAQEVVTSADVERSAVGAGAIAAALASALLGGLLLNIMPCVFPILSLKAMKLAKAGGNEAVVRRDALAYMAGAILTCVMLGGLLLALRAGGAAVGWAFQLQDPRIILLLLVLITAIAFNFAGLFELGSIDAGSSFAEKGGAAGSFWTGALAAFVATPCTGPFMGAALGAALVLPALLALAIFAGLGLGLALPFLLIAFIPALRRRLPRPGPWMGTLRRILAVPMFATALALVWLLGRQSGIAGMTIGLGVAAVAGLLFWWIGARQAHGRRGAFLLSLAIVVAMVGGIMLLSTESGSAIEPKQKLVIGEPFSETRLAALRAEGRPVFLYFTADWCLTCKVNEAAAIDREEVRAAFGKANVATLVGDWTNADPEISRFLERHGRSGVPLYLWYAPDGEMRVLPQVLSPSLLVSLAKE